MKYLLPIKLLVISVSLTCRGDIFEVIEKVSSQALSFVSYATYTEKNLHDCMHHEVAYSIYTTRNKEIRIFANDLAGLRATPFDFNRRTIIVVHGYTDSKKRKIIVQLRKALVETQDANIIVCDWHRAASQIYFTAVSNTYHVGEQLADFLLYLQDAGYNMAQMHIIGHSLGAQIAGVAGSKLLGRVGRITGLDPAGPLFEFIEKRNASVSLDPSDAQFVDIIHSAMGSFGVVKPIGHVDFYPNDGLAPQPGCSNPLLAISCSHVRSIEFFIDTLYLGLPKYLARRCSQWKEYYLHNCSKDALIPMGFYTPTSARGNYYLQTNEEQPYGRDGKFFKRTLLFHFENPYIENT